MGVYRYNGGMGRRWQRLLLLMSLVGILLGLSGPLASTIGHQLVRQDTLTVADAVVILGGDAQHRAPHGAALFAEGLAPVVLAVGGIESDGTRSQAYKTARLLQTLGVPEDRILVSGQYEPSTLQEARAAADYAVDRGWGRIIVVTSPYHTWRAGVLFEEVLESLDIEVLTAPAPEDPFDPDGWWRDDRQRRQVRNEYLKLTLWRLLGS
ncbi:MAG: uncharacterized SAM-binding protein YcdF (DUF218 family) [Myxococcota bacterium]|jgi:uncharacterized SAM-binding protein YcdF (DUF218 family)